MNNSTWERIKNINNVYEFITISKKNKRINYIQYKHFIYAHINYKPKKEKEKNLNNKARITKKEKL